MTTILIECDIGDTIVVRGTLTDEAGATVAGADVTARAIPPSGTETDLGAATDEGGGVYSINYSPTVAGQTLIRFDSAAPEGAAAEGVIYVRESRFS